MKKQLFFLCLIFSKIIFPEGYVPDTDTFDTTKISMPKPKYTDADILAKMAQDKYKFKIINKQEHIDKYVKLTNGLNDRVKFALMQHDRGFHITDRDIDHLHNLTLESLKNLQASNKGFFKNINNDQFSGTLLNDLKNLERTLRKQKNEKNNQKNDPKSNIDKPTKNPEQKPLNPFAKTRTIQDLNNDIKTLTAKNIDLKTQEKSLQSEIDRYNRALNWQTDQLNGAQKQKIELEKEYGSTFFTSEREDRLSKDLVNMQNALNDLENKQDTVSTSIKDKFVKTFGIGDDSYSKRANLIANIEKIKPVLNDFDTYKKLNAKIEDSSDKIDTLQKEQQIYSGEIKNVQKEISQNVEAAKNAQRLIDTKNVRAKGKSRFDHLKDISK